MNWSGPRTGFFLGDADDAHAVLPKTKASVNIDKVSCSDRCIYPHRVLFAQNEKLLQRDDVLVCMMILL